MGGACVLDSEKAKGNGQAKFSLCHPGLAWCRDVAETVCVMVIDKHRFWRTGSQWLLLMIGLCAGALAHAWKMEAGTLNLGTTTSYTQLQSHTFQQVYDTPPVVIILTEDRGGDPSHVRVSNVTTTGFRASQMEPNSEDGPHASMVVTYFAIEPGLHTLDDGTVIEAGIVNTQEQQFNGKEANNAAKADWVKHKLAQKFKKPMVLTHLQTTNNEPGIQPRKPSHPWLTVAMKNIKDDEIEVAIERSEEYDSVSGKDFIFNALTTTESIGYVAIDSDVQGTFNDFIGVPVVFETLFEKTAVDGWDEGCDTINFNGTYSSTPLVLASQSSRVEKDGGWFRECDRNTSRIRLTIDEDQKQDSERKHKKEDASVLVFSRAFVFNSNATTAPTTDIFMLEADSAVLDPSQFTSVSFRQEYEQPPAVFVLGDNVNPEPTTVRIRNVTKTGFEVVPAELQLRNGYSDATDQNTTIHYLAVPYGQFQFPDGKKIEVSSFPITNYQAKYVSGSNWLTFNFKSGFSGTPALIGQIQTMSNETGHTPGAASIPSLETTFRSVTSTSANLALERAETDAGSITQPETVAYLAMETGVITDFFDIDGNVVKAEAVRTPDNIAGSISCYTANFAQTYTGSPLLVGSQNTRDGGDGGWLRRCSTSTSSARIKIEEDWGRDKDNAHTTEVAAFMVFSQPFAADFSQAANYRLEEASWNGTSGEVKDFGNFGLHGTAVGTATPRTAQVCLGASLDGSGYVQVADSDNLDILDELTVMAWIKADQLPASDLMTIVSKDENFEFHLRPDGRVFWWWQGSGGTRSFDTGGYRVTVGDWYHVAITYSKKDGVQKIYVGGVERASRSYANETLAKNTDPLFIGTDLNFASRNFKGLIDEVRVFTRALSATAINRYKDITRPCDSCALGSFEIIQPAFGLACPDTRAEVTIRAVCDDGTTTKEDYDGVVNLSASPDDDAQSDSVFYDTATGGTIITDYDFDGSEKGEVKVYLYHTNENVVTASGTDAAASITTSAVTGTDFRTQGFKISSTPSNFVCGNKTTMALTAYGQGDNGPGGACEVIENFSPTEKFDVWFEATTGILPEPAKTLTIAGTDIASSVTSATADRNLGLTFTSGVASFEVAYANAARIDNINFRFDQAPYDKPEFEKMTASTASIVVRPDAFLLASSAANPHTAGAPFDLSITATCEGGPPTPTATHYQPNAPADLEVYLERTGPVAGGAEGELAGVAMASGLPLSSALGSPGTYLDANVAFSNGVFSTSAATYSEVGDVKFYVKDNNYYGEAIPAVSIPLGRFKPAYFVATDNTPTFRNGTGAWGCNFTYQGQTFGFDTGQDPQVTLTAFNAQGTQTQNYIDTYADINGVLTSNGVWSYVDKVGGASSLDTSASAPSDSVIKLGNGQVRIDISNETFVYQKSGSLPVASDGPFNARVDLDFPAAYLTDDDAVCVKDDKDDTTCNDYTIADIGSTEIRYGRWNMESQAGPETGNLSLFAQAEYWNGTEFQRNTLDSCTNLASAINVVEDGDNDFAAIPVGGGSSNFTYAGPLSAGQGNFLFSSPGSGNTGTLNLEVDLSAFPWLQFDWYGTGAVDHPDVKATFGVYRGHDRIIYWRELNP